MSFKDRKGSFGAFYTNKGSVPTAYGSLKTPHVRKGSIQAQYGSLGDTPVDTECVPNSVLERRSSMASQSERKQSVSSTTSERITSKLSTPIHFKNHENTFSNRKWFLGPFCFLYAAAYVSSTSVFVQYIYQRIHHEMFPDINSFNISGCNKSDINFKNQNAVQARASSWNMYYNLATGVPAMLASILLGSSSDKFGRKFLFFLPCIGALVKLSVCALGIYLNFNLWYFMIGFVFEGFSGYISTMLLAAYTYIADLTPPTGKQRSLGITLIELTNGIAATILSFVTGYFIQGTGYFYPMLMSAIFVFVCIFIVFLIPESFPKNKRISNESVGEKLVSAFAIFFGASNKEQRWRYNILMLIFSLTMFASFGQSSIEPLYQLDTPFCWTPEKLGYYGALSTLVQQIIGMGMIKLLQNIMSDEAIAMFGSLSYGAGYLIEGLAKTDIIMYMAPVVGICGLLTIPVCRSLMSKLTGDTQQGSIFAAIAAVETAINMGGTVAANEIYSHTLNLVHGFVFFLFSGCSLVGFILLGIYHFGSRRTYLTSLDVFRR